MALLAAYSFDETGDTVTDYSGNGHDFTIAGTNVVRTASGHTNGGLVGNGATQAELPDIGRTASRTVMLWLDNVELVPDGWPIIFNVPSIDSGAWGILQLSGSVHIQARNASGFARASITRPTDGLWHHYAGTYDGSTVRLYLDGIAVASAALAGPLRTDSDPPKLLGWNADTPIDDLRLYDEALSQAAIADLMNTPVDSSSVTGALSGTIPALTGNLTADVVNTGVLGGTLPILTGALTGTAVVSGVLGGTLPALTGGLTGTAIVEGILNGQLPAVTGALTDALVTAGWPPRAGSVTVTGVATATVSMTGVATATVSVT